MTESRIAEILHIIHTPKLQVSYCAQKDWAQGTNLANLQLIAYNYGSQKLDTRIEAEIQRGTEPPEWKQNDQTTLNVQTPTASYLLYHRNLAGKPSFGIRNIYPLNLNASVAETDPDNVVANFPTDGTDNGNTYITLDDNTIYTADPNRIIFQNQDIRYAATPESMWVQADTNAPNCQTPTDRLEINTSDQAITIAQQSSLSPYPTPNTLHLHFNLLPYPTNGDTQFYQYFNPNEEALTMSYSNTTHDNQHLSNRETHIYSRIGARTMYTHINYHPNLITHLTATFGSTLQYPNLESTIALLRQVGINSCLPIPGSRLTFTSFKPNSSETDRPDFETDTYFNFGKRLPRAHFSEGNYWSSQDQTFTHTQSSELLTNTFGIRKLPNWANKHLNSRLTAHIQYESGRFSSPIGPMLGPNPSRLQVTQADKQLILEAATNFTSADLLQSHHPNQTLNQTYSLQGELIRNEQISYKPILNE